MPAEMRYHVRYRDSEDRVDLDLLRMRLTVTKAVGGRERRRDHVGRRVVWAIVK